MKLRSICLALAAATGLPGAASAQAAPFNRQAWIDDYGAIKHQLGQYYANLDSRFAALRVNPARLDKQMLGMLAAARSDLQAYDALRDMIALFDDKHLKFEFGDVPGMDQGSVGNPAPVAVSDCKSAGYKDGAAELPAIVTGLAGWRAMGGDAFPHGMAGDTGVLRIPSFSESYYGSMCRRALSADMGERELQLATRAALLTELTRVIAALKAAGATRLLIDLTGNGGGTEWDIDAAAMFTGKTLRRSEPRIADAPCDRSGVWTGKAACDVYREASSGTKTVQGTGQWTGTVLILADWRTASASEEFIGWLADNKAARLIGEKTMGAGCGYVDGAHPLRLKAAPVTLMIPNCARFSAAGVNEIAGWSPDVPIPTERWNSAGLAAAITQATG